MFITYVLVYDTLGQILQIQHILNTVTEKPGKYVMHQRTASMTHTCIIIEYRL